MLADLLQINFRGAELKLPVGVDMDAVSGILDTTVKPANLCQPLKYKKLKPKSSRKKRMTNRPAMSMKIAGLGIHDTAVSWS